MDDERFFLKSCDHLLLKRGYCAEMGGTHWTSYRCYDKLIKAIAKKLLHEKDGYIVSISAIFLNKILPYEWNGAPKFK